MQPSNSIHWKNLLLCSLVAIALAAMAAWGTSDAVTDMTPDADEPMACANLAALALPDTTITLAEALPAGPFAPPGGSRPLPLPAVFKGSMYNRPGGPKPPGLHNCTSSFIEFGELIS